MCVQFFSIVFFLHSMRMINLLWGVMYWRSQVLYRIHASFFVKVGRHLVNESRYCRREGTVLYVAECCSGDFIPICATEADIHKVILLRKSYLLNLLKSLGSKHLKTSLSQGQGEKSSVVVGKLPKPNLSQVVTNCVLFIFWASNIKQLGTEV